MGSHRIAAPRPHCCGAVVRASTGGKARRRRGPSPRPVAWPHRARKEGGRRGRVQPPRRRCAAARRARSLPPPRHQPSTPNPTASRTRAPRQVGRRDANATRSGIRRPGPASHQPTLVPPDSALAAQRTVWRTAPRAPATASHCWPSPCRSRPGPR